MTEQLIYNIYRIINSVDNKIYIGSTRQTIKQRMYGHNTDARNEKNTKPIATHMRQVGAGNFSIELIETISVDSRKDARIREQEEIDKIDKEICLNCLKAYSHNREKTRDQVKKRACRRSFYNRKKEDPVWMEKERERNRIRMRKKRAELKNTNEQESPSETER